MNLLKEENEYFRTSISIIKEKKENIKKQDKIPKKILSMKKFLKLDKN